MQNFAYKNPTEILFGAGQVAEIASRIPADAQVLMLYGGGSIKANGAYDQVVAALGGHNWTEFGGVEANPTYETLMQALDVVRDESIDFILAVGGGSVGDGAKFIAAAAKFDGEPWDILAKGSEVTAALPLGVVLTLPATGTESNGNAVVTRTQTQQKLAFGSPWVRPVFAVLDPAFTLTLPTRQVGNGVVDAFVHVIEQYLTYPTNAPLQDRFAESILSTLIEEGPKALSSPEDLEVRANVMWCACMALNGLIGQGVPQDWATHMIGHELTAVHGLDHAQTLAVVLPSLLRVKIDAKRAKLEQLGARVFGRSGDAAATIDAVEAFFESMGVATRLSGYGLDQSAVAPVIASLTDNGMLALGEHGDITPQTANEILTLAG
ncbi:iron-containing alcohol dehydrogenase [Litorivicinus lipolyticus]|uniref:iron-containing alcohol dehydrogenase n=1 Tax=Litorivicinus lipolyticus TaxID=418701 RepID=UPI003B5926BF